MSQPLQASTETLGHDQISSPSSLLGQSDVLVHEPVGVAAGVTQVRHLLPHTENGQQVAYVEIASITELVEVDRMVTGPVLELFGADRTETAYLEPVRGTLIAHNVAAGQHGEGLVPHAHLIGDGEQLMADFALHLDVRVGKEIAITVKVYHPSANPTVVM